MFCKNCGAQMDDNAIVCESCGAEVKKEEPVTVTPAPQQTVVYTAPAQVEYRIPEENRPLSPWAYFGLQMLFSIPVVGFVFLIVFSCSGANINRRNFARSYWCGLLMIAVIAIVAIALIVLFALLGMSTGGSRAYHY